MTTPPLPELFERVAAKVQEIAIDESRRRLKYWRMAWWWFPPWTSSLPPKPVRECNNAAFIESACVRWLCHKEREPQIYGAAFVYQDDGSATVSVWCVRLDNGDDDALEFHAPTLAHALLLAVEAVGGGGKEVNP